MHTSSCDLREENTRKKRGKFKLLKRISSNGILNQFLKAHFKAFKINRFLSWKTAMQDIQLFIGKNIFLQYEEIRHIN